MKGDFRQQQELKLQQRLTPMQVQFVRMLEMTGPEVEAEVAQQLEDMPALEVADNGGDGAEERFDESSEQMQLADYATDDDTPSYMLRAKNRGVDDAYYEPEAVNDEESLAESLMNQLTVVELDESARVAAENIIGNLDGNGYLRRSLDAIADDVAFSTGVDLSAEAMAEGWEAVRRLDPAGVGAVDLRDCLLLQLQRRERTDAVALAIEILDHYFDLFSKKHYQKLVERLGVDRDQLSEAIALIAKLNPKPGNQHGDTAIESVGRMIVPEFAVEPHGDSLTVTLLNNIPELTLSETFREDVPAGDMTARQRAEAQTFIRTRREEASNFIRTLKMRQTTLFNVMTAIARIQRDFFMTGDETKLRPMILKDVAEMTGYNLSVISRATASKYVVTVAGVYPLKFFFNERPKEDDDATFHQIAAAIRAIVDAEDKQSPITDEAITERLNADGLNIARRTVAKYRERMGIPVARLRKEL